MGVWMNTFLKRGLRVFAVVAVALVAIAAFSPAAYAAKGWTNEDGTWYYYENNGTKRTNNWAAVGSTYYYLGADGKVVTNGWGSYQGSYYYLGSDGKVVTNDFVPYGNNNYYVGANGKVVIDNWISYKGSYYYIGKNGLVVTGDWVKWSGKYYYMGVNGKPLINNSVIIDGTYYYFDSTAACTMYRPASLDAAVTKQYEWHSGDYSYQFVVPKLNIYSAFANKISTALTNLTTYAKEQASVAKAGGYPEAVYIDYEIRFYGDNLTIDLFIEFDNNSWRQDYVYNININTGEENTTAHMLQLKGMSQANYNTLLKDQVSAWWKYYFPDSVRQLYPQGYDSAYAQTISANNLSSAVLCIDGGGTLYANVKFYQIVGATYSYQWVLVSG